jgi:prevent-host-death family protein
MVMKAINVAELKAHLSSYLRMAQDGEHIVVMDRKTPIAEIVPIARERGAPWARLARSGLVRPGTQDWGSLETSALKKRVSAAKLLDAVRDDDR